MSAIDWIVLSGSLLFIVVYGIYQSRGSNNIEGYFLGNNESNWWSIGLSVMATQASAITLLSTPGQAFDDGMRFVQFYLGMPLAIIVLCITFIPNYFRLKVYTSYEYLESRFDLKTRTLASFLFQMQRGLAAGIVIYAPSIILSTILGWNLGWTNLLIGVLVIVYTVVGGTKAVNQTHTQQMLIIFLGLVAAFGTLVYLLPQDVTFNEAMVVAGKAGKLNAITFDFDLNDRYNFWSGLIGGFFLMLSYYGTDQLQVQRYLSGQSVKESRLGLIFNALFKIPMQFFILLIGVMVFVFYQFNQPPVFFNQSELVAVQESKHAQKYDGLVTQYEADFEAKRGAIDDLLVAYRNEETQAIQLAQGKIERHSEAILATRNAVKTLVKEVNPDAETKDTDYVFITFIVEQMPRGLVGLLIAMIFAAAMSSIAAVLNALSSSTTIDVYKRMIKPDAPDQHYVQASRLFTLMWGIIAILFATYASLLDNLIQFINIIGSLFYGTILGIFLTAFYVKYVQANAVFIGALIAQVLILMLFWTTEISFLWFTVIGCFLVISFGVLIQRVIVWSTKRKV